MKLTNRMAAAGLMVGLFVAGGIAGGAAMYFLGSGQDRDVPGWERRSQGDRDAERHRGRPGDPRSFTTDRVVERLENRLELTSEQRDSVAAILERQRTAASAVFREMGPRLRATVDSANTRIRDLLDENQRARFEELLRRERGVLGQPPPPDRDGGR